MACHSNVFPATLRSCICPCEYVPTMGLGREWSWDLKRLPNPRDPLDIQLIYTDWSIFRMFVWFIRKGLVARTEKTENQHKFVYQPFDLEKSMFRRASRCCQCDEFLMKAIVVTEVSSSFIDCPSSLFNKIVIFQHAFRYKLHTTQRFLIENVSLSEGDPMIEW